MGTLKPTYDIKKLEGHDVCQENNTGQGKYNSSNACQFALGQMKRHHLIPGATGPPDTWPDKYHKTNKLSCCEIVAIVAGSLVLLLLLASLVSSVSNGAKKSRRTVRKSSRRK